VAALIGVAAFSVKAFIGLILVASALATLAALQRRWLPEDGLVGYQSVPSNTR
jgi:hypothetical protein